MNRDNKQKTKSIIRKIREEEVSPIEALGTKALEEGQKILTKNK